MRKLFYAAVGAAALCTASLANAALTITGSSGTTAGSVLTVGSADNSTVPNKVAFDTFTDTAGTYTSFFEFTENMTSIGSFSVTAAALGAQLTLEQLLPGGGGTALYQAIGSSNSLTLVTGPLTAGTTYRFTYTGTAPAGGADFSGNAAFYSAVPEPATWAMMLLGFGGIGMAMRRRRKPVLAQVA